MFARSRRLKELTATADQLYAEAVRQARTPVFYDGLGVPDTLDGRFEMISLHVFLLIDRLRRDGEEGRELAQALFDAMFTDMDVCLREMGVGDLSVGKKVKQMAEGFNGRSIAYSEALEAGEPGEPLREALRRNVYGTLAAPPPPGALDALSGYVRGQWRRLGEIDLRGETGRTAFGAPPQLGEAAL